MDRPPPRGPCGANSARGSLMRPPWCGGRTQGIPLGLLAFWVAAARCLQSKCLIGRPRRWERHGGWEQHRWKGDPYGAVWRPRCCGLGSFHRLQAGGALLESPRPSQGSSVPRCLGALGLCGCCYQSRKPSVLEITCSLPGPGLLCSNFYFLFRNNQGVTPGRSPLPSGGRPSVGFLGPMDLP